MQVTVIRARNVCARRITRSLHARLAHRVVDSFAGSVLPPGILTLKAVSECVAQVELFEVMGVVKASQGHLGGSSFNEECLSLVRSLMRRPMTMSKGHAHEACSSWDKIPEHRDTEYTRHEGGHAQACPSRDPISSIIETPCYSQPSLSIRVHVFGHYEGVASRPGSRFLK